MRLYCEEPLLHGEGNMRDETRTNNVNNMIMAEPALRPFECRRATNLRCAV